MDAKNVGTTIARLRKSKNLTQAELAAKLNVSAKTISKWENGLGYPEIVQFPELAAVFGVSVDYLMNGGRRGITIAGNIITDIVKTVDCYPKIGMLANVSSVSRAVGGCAPNTAMDLAVIDRSLPLSVLGRVGDDENGRYLLSKLGRHGIDTERHSADDHGICRCHFISYFIRASSSVFAHFSRSYHGNAKS
jgi:transcriptional regulator with XRE-family HTH domain